VLGNGRLEERPLVTEAPLIKGSIKNLHLWNLRWIFFLGVTRFVASARRFSPLAAMLQTHSPGDQNRQLLLKKVPVEFGNFQANRFFKYVHKEIWQKKVSS